MHLQLMLSLRLVQSTSETRPVIPRDERARAAAGAGPRQRLRERLAGRLGGRLGERLGERVGALRYLPTLFREIAAASPRLLAASLSLRLVAACLPVLTLYLAKLILDGIVAEHARPAPEAGSRRGSPIPAGRGSPASSPPSSASPCSRT